MDTHPTATHESAGAERSQVSSTVEPTDDGDRPRETPPDAEGHKLVPVTEAIRYRKRAQAAEQQLGEFRSRLEGLQSELQQANQAIEKLERRQKIDALLADSDAIDLDVARLLTESAVEVMDDPDIAIAVEELRRQKPYLFRNRPVGAATAMSPRLRDLGDQPSQQAAEQASTTGDRRDLLRYLRLRRSK